MQCRFMKRLFSRLWVQIGSAFMTAFIVLRFVLEVIGYATLPDDAKEAHGVLRVLADMVLALPWWAIWWPLFLSYIATCLIALDFSFDIFKRKPKRRPQSDSEKLAIISDNFISKFHNINSEHSSFHSRGHEISAESEVEIFVSRLKGFGIEPPKSNGNVRRKIVSLKRLISRYRPFLKAGDYEKAIEVANNP